HAHGAHAVHVLVVRRDARRGPRLGAAPERARPGARGAVCDREQLRAPRSGHGPRPGAAAELRLRGRTVRAAPAHPAREHPPLHPLHPRNARCAPLVELTVAYLHVAIHLVLVWVLPPLLLGVINKTKAVFAGRKGPPLL